MSYPLPPQPTERARALPGLAGLMIATLLLELGILGYDFGQKGPVYLVDALGFTYAHVTDAPVGFFGGDAANCVALLVMIIAAFTGRGWIRAAGTVLLLVDAYASVDLLIIQLTNSESRAGFATPNSHLLLNLDEIAQIILALAFAVVVAATSRPAPRPMTPGFAPGFPPQGNPYGYAQQPPATAPYSYPPAPTDPPRPF